MADGTKRYMALIYGDEAQGAQATPEDWGKMIAAYNAFTEAARIEGVIVLGDG